MERDGWGYFSYNNKDYSLAIKFGQEFLVAGYNLWLDRLLIAPSAAWHASILQMQTDVEFAIILLSDSYVASDYCLDELNQFQERAIKLIAIRLNPELLNGAADEHGFTAIVDLANPYEEDNYSACLDEIRTLLHGFGLMPAIVSEEKQYLIKLIAEIETTLMQSITGRIAALNLRGDSWQSQQIRPRCHAPNAWLFNADYRVYDFSSGDSLENWEQSRHVALANLLEWLDLRSRMMLVGAAATGKTNVLRYLCLAAAFNRLESGITYPLPYYLDLENWQARADITVFIAQNWSLSSDVLELLRRGAVILFADGLSEVDTTAQNIRDAMIRLIEIEDFPALVLTSRLEGVKLASGLAMPLVQLERLNASQSDLIAEATLGDTAANLPSQALGWNLEALVIWLLSKSIDEADMGQGNIKNVLPALWRQIEDIPNNRFNLDALKAGLEFFVFAAYDYGTMLYYPRQLALKAMGNDLLIQIAEYLGVLESRGDELRFSLPSLQIYLAARKLLDEGIYTRLQQPQFDTQGQKQANSWDRVILFASNCVSSESLASFIQTVADLDPYLAFECAQINDVLDSATKRDILSRLIEPKRPELRSMDLSKQLIGQIGAEAAGVILEELCGDSWARRQIAAELIQAVDCPMPINFLEVLEEIESDFPDAVHEALDYFTERMCLVNLCQITMKGTVKQRLKAIYILGELASKAGAAVLCGITRDESSLILKETANALGKIQDSAALPTLYALLTHPEKEPKLAALAAVKKLELGLKSRLVEFLVMENALTVTLADSLLQVSPITLRQILDYLLGTFGYGQSHSIDLDRLSEEGGDMVRRLLDILSSKMASLRSREAFQAFADETLKHRSEIPAKRETAHHRLQAEKRARNANSEVLDEQHVAATGIPDHLLKALAHEDWLVRFQAVQQLAHYPDSLSIEHLIKATQDTDAQVKTAAIESLPSKSKYSVILETLLSALEDEDSHVVDAAAERLQDYDGEILGQLLKKLDTVPLYSLAVLLDLLGNLAYEETVETLSRFLDDEREPWLWDCSIGDIAAKALLSIGTLEALQAVQASGRMNYPEVAEIILPGMDGEDYPMIEGNLGTFANLLRDLRSTEWEISQAASRKMRSVAHDMRDTENYAEAKYLAENLNDSYWLVRWTIVEALAWLKNPSVLPQLLTCLDDENWTVQLATIRALVELNARDYASELEPLLFHEQSAVREAAAEGLGELANPTAIPSLNKALNDKDQFVRLAVVRAFIAIRDIESFRLLAKVLKDKYSHIRWYAVRAMAELADPALLKDIVPLLRDDEKPAWEKHSIAEYAELTLHRMGTSESKEILSKWGRIKLKDKSKG